MKSHRHRALAAVSVITFGFASLAQAVPVSGQGTWESTLQGRDLDGNLSTFEAYYDSALNVTWLADANYAKTTSLDPDGAIDWATANAWVASLNPYGSGIAGWRLPTAIDADGPDADLLGDDGCNPTPAAPQGLDCGYNISVQSELSHMYYTTLGNKAPFYPSGAGGQPGWGLSNTGPFSNVVESNYWTATTYAPDTSTAWYLDFYNGRQGYGPKTFNLVVWAVHPDDVGTPVVIPIPAAAWLLGSGLLGLVGVTRRKRHFR